MDMPCRFSKEEGISILATVETTTTDAPVFNLGEDYGGNNE